MKKPYPNRIDSTRTERSQSKFVTLRNWLSRSYHLGLSGLLILVSMMGTRIFAQVIADPSLGTEVTLNADGTTLEITGGTTVGDINLFHSFSNFSVKSEEVVDFQNVPTINNIFVRVTGGNPSDIQGILQAQGQANLFLINPKGIVFGENAELNIGGSFIATTANLIQFPDGGEFSMTSPVNPFNPLLKVNPSAFLFNQIATEPISSIQVNEAFLSLRESQSLVLLGGNVNLRGARLEARSGRIELGGLNGEGMVKLNIDSNNFHLTFPDDVARADISLSDTAKLTVTDKGGGGIQVQGKRVTLADDSSITVNTLVSKSGGTLVVNASELVELLGGSRLLTDTQGSGTAGELRIETGGLILQDGAQISASTLSEGQGGTLSIIAKDFIQLTGTSQRTEPTSSALFTITKGGGSAGNLQIETGQLIVQDGAQISASTLSDGQGGTLSIAATDSIKVIGTSPIGKQSSLLVGTEGRGSAGNLQIETGQLIVQDGAQISASTLSDGQGGTLSIAATDSIKVIGTSPIGKQSSLLVGTEGRGSAGNLQIETGQLIVQDGAQISASTLSEGQGGTLSIAATDSIKVIGTSPIGKQSSLLVGTEGRGSAGNLQIETGQLIVQDGAQISASTLSDGQGGTLSIAATDSIKVIGTSPIGQQSGLLVGTEGRGSAGNLQIETGQLIVQDGAQISASTRSEGQGGTLSIAATDSIKVIGTSPIGQQSGLLVGTEGRGSAGNLQIETGQLIVQDGAQISASTSVDSTGQGGSIIVKAGELNVLNDAEITVSSKGTKQAGDLEITARSIKLYNQGKLIGEANSGDGGNIKLNLQKLLLLGRNSQISTSAGAEGAGGNGGNIIINIPNGFILTKPNENNDITANAYDGKGGTIIINAIGIFGIRARSREELIRLLGNNNPNQIDPQKLLTNDITAISQTNPTLNGQITINAPDTDPNRGLLNLPSKLGEPKITKSCQTTTAKNQSSFVITGRGGLPPNPKDILTPDAVQIDRVSLKPSSNNRSLLPVTSKAPKRIIEATAATLNAKGEIVLTANSSIATPHHFRDTPDDCLNNLRFFK